MAKPKAIQWLEKETGQSIPYVPDEQESEGRSVTCPYASTARWRSPLMQWQLSAA